MTPADQTDTLSHLLDQVDDIASEAPPCPPSVAHCPPPLARVRVADVMRLAGAQAYGPILVLVGLFSVSPATALPGMTWMAAAATLFVATQMALGVRQPWLPRAALEASLPRPVVSLSVRAVRPWAARIEAHVRPRLRFLAEPPWTNVLAVFMILAAAVTVPLGLVPFAPIVPGLAVTLFGLGVLAKDGVLLAVSAGTIAGLTTAMAMLIL